MTRRAEHRLAALDRVDEHAAATAAPYSKTVVAEVGARRPHSEAARQRSLDAPAAGVDSLFALAGLFAAPTWPLDQALASTNEMTRLAFEHPEVAVCAFMRSKQCYELVPASTKLVVFDTELPVRKAFFALVYNGVRAAPLWDSRLQAFVGMLTITDFIHILHRYYKSGQTGGISELETHKIATWRDVLASDGKLKQLISVDPCESLYKAVRQLCDNRVHRLPVLDRHSGNIIYILTHKRIIKYLYINLHSLPRPSYLHKTPRELGIGTWDKVVTAKQSTAIIEVLSMFLERRISALPVCDDDGRVVDIYAKFDVIHLAAQNAYNDLDVPVLDALRHRSAWFEGVRHCCESDSLATVIERLVKAEVHRIVVTDGAGRPAGIVSLSDILQFLVLDNDIAHWLQSSTAADSMPAKRQHTQSTSLAPPVDEVIEPMECEA